MPATFPSHAAAVLPLKLWRPRWFDGVALVIGSAAPDLLYPLAGVVSLPETHTISGVFWCALPITLVASVLVRRAAPIVAAHLPTEAARDYGVLGRVRYRWYVTVWSALLGAASHILWDGFTHDPGGHGWAARQLTALQRDGLFGRPWWTVTQVLSTVAGALVVGVLAVHMGRWRLLRRWHGAPPAAPTAPLVFWPVAGLGPVLYLVTWPVLPYRWAPHVQGVRLLWAVAFSLLAAAWTVGRRHRAAGASGRRRMASIGGCY
jgi:hypothetical protein